MTESTPSPFDFIPPAEDRPAAGGRAPLAPIALGLIAGIAADGVRAIPAGAAVTLFAAAVIAARRLGGRWKPVCVATCAAACGSLLHDAHQRHLPARHILHHLPADGQVTVQGRIATLGTTPRPPAPWQRDHRRPCSRSAELEVRRLTIDGVSSAVCGRIRLRLPALPEGPGIGDEIRVRGRPFRWPAPRNPGATRIQRARSRRGIHVGLHCREPRAMRRLAPPKGWRGTGARLRQAVARRFARDLQPEAPGSGLLEAMVLGRRWRVSDEVRRAFSATGAAHFLALSGLHVGLVVLFVTACIRPWAGSNRRRAVLVLAGLLAYGSLVEPSPSVHRALALAVLAGLACLLRRPYSGINALCAACIVLLVGCPALLFRPGFQLSFAITLGLMTALRTGRRALPRTRPAARPSPAPAPRPAARQWLLDLRLHAWPAARRVILSYLTLTGCVCIVAWVVGMPLVAFHFGRLQPYGPVVSWTLAPLVLLTMMAGLGHLLVAGLLPACSWATALPAAQAAEWLAAAAEVWARVPGCSLACPRPPLWLLVAHYGVLCRAWRRAPLPRAALRGTLLVAGFTLGLWLQEGPRPGSYRITVLAVRGGQATVLQHPGWGTALFDAGAGGPSTAIATIAPALQALGPRRLRSVVLSQALITRFSALPELLEQLPIGRVAVPAGFERHAPPHTPAGLLLDHLRSRPPPVQLHNDQPRPAWADVLPPGAAVLWPPPELPPGVATADGALVLALRTPAGRIMLLGRLGRYAQQRMMALGDALQADLLVVAAPGGLQGLTPEFLAAVHPAYIVGHLAEPPDAGAAPVPGHLLNVARVGAVSITLEDGSLAVSAGLSGVTRWRVGG